MPGSVSFERRLVERAAGGDQPSGVVLEEPTSATGSSGSLNWEAFAAQVSGEWDGYSAEFNFAGEPIQLPSNIVPDAFREWGVEIHDWQTQAPTLAHPEEGHLWYKVIRLHPTVGCEADAATVYSVQVSDVQSNVSALAYHSSGSYTTVWRGKCVTQESKSTGPGKEVTREGDVIELEQCIVHDRKRIRVLQQLGARRRVMIYRETWEGPFRNGESLCGCATGNSAFATQKPLQGDSLAGSWHAELYTAQNLENQQTFISGELIPSGVEDFDRKLADEALYLPKDSWTCLRKSESGNAVVETGWLVQPDQAIVSICEVGSFGDLKAVSLRVEKRIPGK